MKLLHIIFGVALLIVFLFTGQYMHRYLHHLVGMPDGPRLLYRTRHIFILLSGLLNVGMGIYLVQRAQLWRQILQWLGSILIILASLLFILAFFYDTTRGDLQAPLSHWGMYAIAAGTLLHVFGSLWKRREEFTG
jgi:glucan phosphoethanolaminetransferase (alkaline phosphatase superfamily)